MDKALRVRIYGRVQGVGFRYWAYRLAERFSVSGWVRNEPDGSASAECEGSPENVDAFVARLRLGPPGSRVERAETRDVPAEGRNSFTIEFT